MCESGVTARVDGTDVRVRAPSLLLMILLYENQIGIILPAMVWWYEVPRVCVCICCTQEHDGDYPFCVREFHISMRHYVY